MPVDQVTSKLTQLLPTIVDGLTPNGETPSGAGLLSQATSLLGRLSNQ
jgi:uncharacterized protein YidB (DUF937 family)